jgi:hypothetical protein
MGIRSLHHEIHSLRAIIEQKTGRALEDWNSADELARMLLAIQERQAAQRRHAAVKRHAPH